MEFHECVYCGLTDSPYTKEHILQKGFGTNWILPDCVCEDCNTRVFSRRDKKLIDFVHQWICYDHPDVPQKQFPVPPVAEQIIDHHPSGISPSCRVGSDGSRIYFDQVLVLPNGLAFVTNGADEADLQAVHRVFVSELSKPGSVSFSSKVIRPARDSDNEPIHPRVVRSAPRKYAVIGSDDVEVQQVLRRLESGEFHYSLLNMEFGQPNIRPSIKLPMGYGSILIGDIEQAIAKSAMNLVYAVLGQEVARARQFDPLKNFIMCGSREVGQGFVQLFLRSSCPAMYMDLASYCKIQDCHTAILFMAANVPAVFFVLYQRPVAVIFIEGGQADSPELYRDIPTGIRWDYKQKRWGKLNVTWGRCPVQER